MECKVVCIVLNYNDAVNTIRLSRKLTTFNCIEKVIVIDNSSTDDSIFKLKEITSNSKVKVIENSVNLGYGAGNNIGIRYAKQNLNAKYIMICNPDIDIDEETTKKMMVFLAKNHQYASVSARPVNRVGIRSERPGWNLLNVWQFLREMNCLVYKLAGKRNWIEQGEADCLQGSLLMADIDIIVKCGMYDESFFLYCEEYILAYKFKRMGYKSYVLPYTYKHLHSVSTKKSIHSALRRKRIVLKSQKRYLSRYYGLNKFQMCLLEPYFIFTLLINTFVAKIKER